MRKPVRPARISVFALFGVSLVIAGTVGYLLTHRGRAPVPAQEATQPADATQPGAGHVSAVPGVRAQAEGSSTRVAPGVPTVAPKPDPLADERSFTARLRELGQSEPELTLKLATAAAERFGEGPDAAERNWWSVRALVNLRRFPEARDLAAEMVKRYPGTSWAADVERHLLVHPLGLPSREQMERGVQPTQPSSGLSSARPP